MFWWLLQNTVVAGVLAALVWLTCRVRRLSPTVRHALWLVVLIKLVTPPLVDWPWSLPSGFEFPYAPDNAKAELEAIATPSQLASGLEQTSPNSRSAFRVDPALQEFARRLEAIDQGNSGIVEVLVPLADPDDASVITGWVEVDRDPSAMPAEQGNRVWLTNALHGAATLAPGLWLLGVFLSVAIHGIQVARFQHMLAGSLPPSSSLESRVKLLAATMRVRVPRISVVSQVRSPVIWGGFQTRLVWPASLAIDFESGRWDGVIAHELAHVRRGDHWIGWIELLAGCMYWWNPLLWYIRYQLRENSELACDAIVVWALPDGRRRYAASLIEVLSHFSQVIAPVPVLGIHRLARQAFERRLTMILSERVPAKLSAAALSAIALFALAALPGWSQAQVPTAPGKTAVPSNAAAPVFAPAQETLLNVTQVAPDILPPPDSTTLQALPQFDNGQSATTTNQSSSDDSRIDTLEKKLQALIDEVKAMRTSRNVLARVAAPMAPSATTRAGGSSLTSDVQTLTRATYRLPQAKAEAMAAFLRDHMKTPVEAKIEGDNLVVTAAPVAQSAIEQFIALSEGIVSDHPNYQQFRYVAPANLQGFYRNEPAKQAAQPNQPDPNTPGTPATPKRK